MRPMSAAEPWVTIAALCGLLALAQQGGAMVVACTAAALVCLVPRAWREAGAEVPWPLVTVPIVIMLAGLVYIGLSPQHAVGLGLVYLLAQRRLAAVGPHDDRISLVLSALLFALAATRTDSPSFFVPLMVWMVALPMALLRIDLDASIGPRPRRRDALERARLPWLLVPGTIGLAVLIFILLPRVREGTARPPPPPMPILGEGTGTAVTGVPTDEVAPGGVAELLDSDAEVFRVWFDELPEEDVYFRAVSFAEWDGVVWRRGHSSGAIVEEEPVPPDALRVEVIIDDVKDGVLLTTGAVYAVQEAGGETFYPDVEGNVVVRREGRATYTLVTQPPLGPAGSVRPNKGELTRYIEHPRLDPRVEALVGDLTRGQQTPRDKVGAMAAYLQNALRYSRVPGTEGQHQPLEWFLFEGQQGHCEYFATAMTLMARAARVPARFVNGYVGGETNPAGYLVFREAHAHAWTEVWLGDDVGWVIVDATPTGPVAPPIQTTPVEQWQDAASSWWYRTVLGYDGGDQAGAVVGAARTVEAWMPAVGLGGSGPWLGIAGIVLVVVGLGMGVTAALGRTLDRLAGEAPTKAPLGRVAKAHARARARILQAGWVVPRSLPPLAAAKWVRTREPGQAAEALEELAMLHYQVRYGGGDDRELATRADELERRVGEMASRPEG